MQSCEWSCGWLYEQSFLIGSEFEHLPLQCNLFVDPGFNFLALIDILGPLYAWPTSVTFCQLFDSSWTHITCHPYTNTPSSLNFQTKQIYFCFKAWAQYFVCFLCAAFHSLVLCFDSCMTVYHWDAIQGCSCLVLYFKILRITHYDSFLFLWCRLSIPSF